MSLLDTLNYRLFFRAPEHNRKFVMETIAHLNPCWTTDGLSCLVDRTDNDAAALALADWPMPEGVDPERWLGAPPNVLFEPGGYGEVGLRPGETVVRLSPPRHAGNPTAPDILQRAAQHMQDRAAARDQAGGERSMRRTVDAFNALTGHAVSERDGWLFMAVLKMARATTTPTGVEDDYSDGSAYFALAGEAAQEKKA